MINHAKNQAEAGRGFKVNVIQASKSQPLPKPTTKDGVGEEQ